MSAMEEGVVWCRPDLSIEFTNPGFSRMTGIDSADMADLTIFDFIDIRKENVALLTESCKAAPLHTHTLQVTINSKSKEELIGEAGIMWVPDDNRESGFLVVVRDVTGAVQLRRQLHLSEDRYRSLYENSPALIIGMNATGGIIFANPAMIRQTGFTEDELKTMGFKDLLASGVENVNLEELFAQRLASPSQLQEIQFKAKSGDWKTFVFNTYPLNGADGAVAGLAGIGVDITETQRLNEQIVKTQRLELLGQLSAGLAHDFNNIIHLISGLGQILLLDAVDAKTKDTASTILAATERAGQIIKKLFSFSRGETQLKLVRTELNTVVSEVSSLIVGSVSGGINIGFEIPEQKYYIAGDSVSIHQVLLNLCINARDAIKELSQKTGNISVRICPSPQNGFVRLEVADDGPGMSPEVREKIFDPFFTTKKERGGTGLGLSVVYGIVRSHNGTISVDSTPGGGTTFRIDLPLYAQAPGAQRRGNGTILIYNDNVGVRVFCSETLKHYGYASVEFGEADNALEWLKRHADETWLVLSYPICRYATPTLRILPAGAGLQRAVYLLSGWGSRNNWKRQEILLLSECLLTNR